ADSRQVGYLRAAGIVVHNGKLTGDRTRGGWSERDINVALSSGSQPLLAGSGVVEIGAGAHAGKNQRFLAVVINLEGTGSAGCVQQLTAQREVFHTQQWAIGPGSKNQRRPRGLSEVEGIRHVRRILIEIGERRQAKDGFHELQEGVL